MRLVTVVGARPQFVKAAPLSRAVRRHHEEVLVHTGQHYDDNMSAVFFRELGVPPPDRFLGVGSGTHAEQTAAMLVGIERVLLDVKPDIVVVLGDTNSTLAGALAASKLGIPVAHVEAGLRSFSRTMPEELNRVTTDHLSTLLFAPSPQAATWLANEGVREGVFVVGDIMRDSVEMFRGRADVAELLRRLAPSLAPHGYLLATIHRAENTDDPARLRAILDGLARCAMPAVLPVHPRTRRRLAELAITVPAGVHLVDPVGYLDMLALEAGAACVVTDSGGVQKEAYYLGVPCVTARDQTEWVETVQAGWNVVVGADAARIAAAVDAACRPEATRRARPDLYGDGTTAVRIADALSAHATTTTVP